MKKNFILLLFFFGLLGYSQTNPSDVDSEGAKTVNIKRPAVLAISGKAIDATILNIPNGKIENFQITGGTTTYKETWTKDNGSFDTPTSYKQFLAGVYIVSVSDANGCTASKEFIIQQPKQLEVIIDKHDLIECYGDNTGTLTASAIGGYPFLPENVIPDYQYEWYGTDIDGISELETKKNGKTVSGLEAGYYKVKVFDEAGHSAFSKPVFLDSNPQIKATEVISHPKCFGDNGSITLTINGGTAGYSIVWKNGSNNTIANTPVVNNNGVYTSTISVPSGSYSYTITDALKCDLLSPEDKPLSINTAPDELIIVKTERIQPTSKTAKDGQITVTVQGGTPNNGKYTYTWTKGGDPFTTNTNDSGVTTGLENGVYIVTVTDANNCFKASEKIVLDALNVTITKLTDVNCYGEKTGSLIAEATGGNGSTYFYNWYEVNGPDVTDLKIDTKTINSLAKGTYRVEVKDNKNNIIYVFAEETINAPDTPLEATNSFSSISCFGAKDGKATITAKGGSPNYTYTWKKDGLSFDYTTNSSVTLEAGDYTVTVTDAKSCTATVSFTIIEPKIIEIPTPTITKVLINGQSTGAISIAAATGGTGTLKYKWTSSTTIPSPSDTKDISGLKAGDYTLTVTDANSCSESKIFTVEENPVLKVELKESSSIQCFGNSDGEITAEVSGGVKEYTYKWFKYIDDKFVDIPGTINTIPEKETGRYKVIVSDQVGAITSAEITLSQPDPLKITFDSAVNILCYGENTGAIKIKVEGGIPNNGNYTYSWTKVEDSNYTATTDNLSAIYAGTYNLLVTDKNKCTTELKDIKITQPNAPLAIETITEKNLTGFETQNGILAVEGSEGAGTYTYAWRLKGSSDVIATTNRIDKLPIGTYVVTVIDKNNCSVNKEYNLTQPDLLEIKSIEMAQNTQVKCYGDKTAELTATVIGGVPDYIYKWYNVLAPTDILSTTKTVHNLGAGKYIVAVTDQESNISYGINEYTITQPDPLAITNIKTDVSCKGGNDGTISLTLTGGSSDYSIIWNYDSANNNGKTNITGLPAGTYTVMVSDNNAVNCSINKTITITEPTDDLVIASDNVQNASGFGLSNGKIVVQIFGGTPAYTYKWFKNNVEITGQTTAVLDNQLAGAYKVIVTDSKNCTAEKPFTITEPLELKVSIAIAKTIDCFDGSGILRALATVGTGVPTAQGFYTYKWYRENGTLINTTVDSQATTGNIPKGKYYVTVIDSNDNQTTSPLFEITQPTQIIVTMANKQNVTCYDGFDGVAEINVVGGTPDIVAGAPVYTYLWSNGSTAKNQYTLRKGIYSVTVYDGNLCVGTLNNIVIDQPQDFGFDLDKIVPTIPTAGNSNGALHIEIVGGVAPYRYVCKDSNGTIIKDVPNSTLKQVDFTNLASSIFTVSATDATGCTKSTEFDFNNNVLEISITQSAEITCNNGKNASITAVVNGGFGIRTISWYKNGAKIPNESSALLNNLEIGTYYAVVKDFNKVEVTSKSIVINQPDPIVVTNTQKNVSCLGYNDGTITLTATGGSNSFQYRYKSQDSGYGNWIAFDNLTAVIPNLKANTYDIQVQDNKGCNYTSIVNVKITEPKQLLISQNIIIPATGFGLSNGSINITVQGGTSAYNYQWFTSANIQVTGTTSTASNLAAGKYYAVVTDAKGCSVTSELYEVKQPSLLVVKITPVNAVLCNSDKNASLRANASGGLPGYTYKWFSVPGNGVLGTNITLGNLGIGTYYVEVTDTKDNVSKSDLFTIIEPQKVDNTLSADYTLCGDGKDWTITSAPTGGTKPYRYLWNTGATTEVLTNAAPGNYSVTVTDFNGCSITKSISFVAPPHLDASETIKMPTCYLGSDAKIVVTPIAGTAPYTYLWNTGEKTNILNNASAGKYSIEITDFRGCKITRNYTVIDPPKDVIYLGEDVTLCYEQSLTINASIDDDKATYLWTSDKGFKSTNPIITVSQPADYTVVVTNKLGCQATDTITISSQESAISSEFAMSSQVFVNEKFIIVDISNPKADNIKWKLPPEAVVTMNNGDYAEMSFTKAGEYDITLNTEKGRCTAFQTKTILVTEGEYVDPDDTDLQKKFDLKVYPNPSNGLFTVDVTLDKIMPASIKVYNLNNNVVIASRSENGKDAYSFNFNISGLSSGIYFVLFESQQGSKVRKLIIQ
ncbi:T9SS type A sorting domain-containing protein [Flavobacterium sp. LC2016-12]|uniref:T9SS type A sorting domain-containing protein n=1 Tax=Flavobacterium sp. LC2016-12 TaxID=2783794 RepID=UPI00188B40B8|nr:T9SS type A sorting domain-containing protein [Flavobacterium sp. LC2016-12]MBF4463901.1 T9SS type A sorting domain-containing protein [Flavobacterium sp. LC2016-12]